MLLHCGFSLKIAILYEIGSLFPLFATAGQKPGCSAKPVSPLLTRGGSFSCPLAKRPDPPPPSLLPRQCLSIRQSGEKRY